jgi:hypothetical protein
MDTPSELSIGCSTLGVERLLAAQDSSVAIRAFLITLRAPYGKDGLD